MFLDKNCTLSPHHDEKGQNSEGENSRFSDHDAESVIDYTMKDAKSTMADDQAGFRATVIRDGRLQQNGTSQAISDQFISSTSSDDSLRDVR